MSTREKKQKPGKGKRPKLNKVISSPKLVGEENRSFVETPEISESRRGRNSQRVCRWYRFRKMNVSQQVINWSIK